MSPLDHLAHPEFSRRSDGHLHIVRDVSVRHEAKRPGLLASVVNSSGTRSHAVNLDGTVVSWNRGRREPVRVHKRESSAKARMLAPPAATRGSFLHGGRCEGRHVPFRYISSQKDGCEIEVCSLYPDANRDGGVVALPLSPGHPPAQAGEASAARKPGSLKRVAGDWRAGQLHPDIEQAGGPVRILDGISNRQAVSAHSGRMDGFDSSVPCHDGRLSRGEVSQGPNFNKEYGIVRQNDHASAGSTEAGKLEFASRGSPLRSPASLKTSPDSKLSRCNAR